MEKMNTRYRMNLSEKDLSIMREMMDSGLRRRGEKSKKGSNTEFECNFNAYQPNERAFVRVVTALSMSESFRAQKLIPVMDITGTADPHLRISVLDKAAIAKYLASGIGSIALSNIDALRKIDVVSAPYRIEDYGLSVALRTETKVDNIEAAVSQLQSSSRFNARYKQRISFFGNSGNFRVDCTVVSQSSFVSGTSLNMWDAPKRYEIEVELVNGVAVMDEAWIEFLQLIAFVYANLDASPYCIPADVKRQTLAHLRSLTGATGFVGPKPVSIAVENVMPPRDGKFSIMQGYCVTEKADGEHMLLLVTPDRDAFLIDSRLNVRYTGISGLPQDMANTLLDGEYIQDWKLSSATQAHAINAAAFLAFDVYFNGGASVAHMPFRERIEIMRTVVQAMDKSAAEAFVSVKSKQFVAAEGADIFAASERILTQHRMYEIDGLVFAPLDFPVGANAPGDTATLRGTWPAMLKWKPPHQNTIDFLVRLVSAEAPLDASGDTVVKAQLMASYMGGDRTPLAVIAAITGPNLRGKAGGNIATAKEFATALLVRRGKDGRILCENGEILPDTCVAEFRYDPDHGWKPTRVRHDKTQQLQLTNSIGGTANDFNVARKIWQTIMDPVTVDMITGKERVKTDTDDGVYYNRAVLREQLAMLPMMRFHNWVKDRILGAAAKATSGTSILDVATGKGGDINKWLSAGFTRMVGFDVNPDNLVNEEDGAFARLGDKFANDPSALRRKDIVFAQWDMTAPIDPVSNKALVADATMRSINDAVFGFVSDTKVSRELAHLYGIANKPFDVVSCQFAIHYAFRSKESLDALCRTVSSRLKDGGVFVATCMDGRAVEAALNAGAGIEGRKNGKLVWSIKRGNIPDGDGRGFGREIEVYVESINATHTEYLVDPELLHAAMKDHGLVAPRKGDKIVLPAGPTPWLVPFDAFIKASADVRDDPRAAEAANMTADEKRFSTFNCCAVFVRGETML